MSDETTGPKKVYGILPEFMPFMRRADGSVFGYLWDEERRVWCPAEVPAPAPEATP